ncbi:hypothetical protein H9Y04_45185 [Streptomyces sp. TRM66268-LWL]|uniref:Exosortase/archaeosortase family protein n=1 Tax=Streptomyces polyasparticus TaxID=2767826 RepID=A0ABR7SVY7_9ACTN|nr:exosortase/archaeosortase family protein [Streptomyces polyasparticus]MBC9719676.1 hypothetical protein [Streptomyces polyasparticus]
MIDSLTPPARGLWMRWPTAAALALIATLLWRYAAYVQTQEASVASRLIRTLGMASWAKPHAPILTIGHLEKVFALNVTVECTVAYVLGAFFLLGAIVTACQNSPARVLRALVGVTVAALVFVGVNQLRIIGIAVSIHHWGMGGYRMSHQFLGTLVSMFGLGLACCVLLLALGRGGRAERPIM